MTAIAAKTINNSSSLDVTKLNKPSRNFLNNLAVTPFFRIL